MVASLKIVQKSNIKFIKRDFLKRFFLDFERSDPKTKNKKGTTIMKKTYMQPAILLTKVAAQQMICTSNPDVTIKQNESVDAGSVESRRGGSFWDDEEY
jgi:hypothetical protein